MGMSATQARYLNLTAQQSDLEFQGQQINESRTTLSEQTNNLYSQLQDLSVPTPPSTTEFTTVQYSGKSGTTTYNFDASSVKPGSDGLYNITLNYTDYGKSLSANNGYKTTSVGHETIRATKVSNTTTEEVTGYETDTSETPQGYLTKVTNKPTTGDYYILKDGRYVKGGSEDETYTDGYYTYSTEKPQEGQETFGVKGFTENKEVAKTYTSSELSEIYTLDGKICTSVDGAIKDLGDGKYELVTSNGPFYKKDTNGGTQIDIPNTTGYTIAGKNALELNTSNVSQDEYDGYCQAIKNSGLKKTNGDSYTAEDFYIYFDSDNKIHFALKADVQRASSNKNNTCVTYDFISNGSFTRSQNYDRTKISFDPSTGRITSIDIPSATDEDGNVLSYTTIDISSTSVTDDAAYEDAYNKYEYQKYEYDREQQKINAQMSIIQQEDKKLELKLTRLDNERTQITTEIEALKKVISDNIEKSYKTFSG